MPTLVYVKIMLSTLESNDLVARELLHPVLFAAKSFSTVFNALVSKIDLKIKQA